MAIRVTYNKSISSHTEPLFKQSNIFKLQDLYKAKCMSYSSTPSRDQYRTLKPVAVNIFPGGPIKKCQQ